MVPLSIVEPLLYILDVFKDTLQVALLLVSVGGIKVWLQHWTTFSSVVSGFQKIVLISATHLFCFFRL